MQDTGSGAVCADVLAALPKWFGFPESVAGYVEAAESEPTVMATLGERDCGILTLRIHTPYAAEIIVMGVLPEHHRAGIGQAMLKAAESWLAARDIGYLQVKTLSPRHPDEGYARHTGLLLRLRLPAAGGDARALGCGPAGAADDQDSYGRSGSG